MILFPLLQVISHQLEKLQDVSDKCKTLTKATESQLAFFSQSHEATRSLLESSAAPLESDSSLAELCRYFSKQDIKQENSEIQ